MSDRSAGALHACTWRFRGPERRAAGRAPAVRSLPASALLLPFEIHNATGFRALSPREEAGLLDAARLLQAAFLQGAPAARLKGNKLGMLCGGDGEDSAAARSLFERAGTELGAHVATIRSALPPGGDAAEIRHTAQVLGRLYDAVECLGLAPETVRQLGRDAGIPVYDAASGATHPTSRIAAQLGGPTAPADNRRFVLQALLLGSIA